MASKRRLNNEAVPVESGAAGPLPKSGISDLIKVARDAPPLDDPGPDDRHAGVIGLFHHQIVPSPDNPRKDFEPEDLALLADSIADHGLLQNLVVAHWGDGEDGKHAIIAGERRWRAIEALIADGRWPSNRPIACRVLSAVEASERAVIALLENLVRRDLKPMEEARAFARLRDDFGVGTADIAARINRTQRLVQQRLALLNLDEDDQVALDAGELTIEQARENLARAERERGELELSPIDRLAILEIFKKRGGIGGYCSVQVDPATPTGKHWTFYERDGEHLLHIDWTYHRPLAHHAKGWDKDDAALDAAIDQAVSDCTDAGAHVTAGVEGWWTSWLNGPFELAPEIAARREQERIEADRRGEENAARWKAQDEERLARNDWQERLLVMAQAPVEAAPVMQAFSERHPLPWRLHVDDGVIDAAGEAVDIDTFGTAGLLVRALNRLAGFDALVVLADPEIVADEDDIQDEAPAADAAA